MNACLRSQCVRAGANSLACELVPGVHVLAVLPKNTELAPTYLGCCAYLIAGKNGKYILVDALMACQKAKLVRLLAGLNVQPKDIELVAVTHAHEDHIGCCHFLQQKGAKIAIHRTAKGLPFKPDIRFQDGDVLSACGLELKVLHTPGHTAESSSLILRRADKAVLFLGDIAGWYFLKDHSNPAQVIQSVKRVRAIRADCLCFGHHVVQQNLPEFWKRFVDSVCQGTYSLVDLCDSRAYVARTGKAIMSIVTGHKSCTRGLPPL